VPEGNPARYGNTDVNATFNRYRPILQRYADAGVKVILVLTHLTFGEGQGYVRPQMNTERWRDLTGKFAEIARQTAAVFNNTGLVYAYQIWNEQDTEPQNARAAVPMPATDYGFLLSSTIQAIRQVDQRTTIITGGLVGGPELGAAYTRQSFAAMPASVRPDGVAFHPYGRGAEHEYSVFGSITHAVNVYRQVLPNRPVWITEWGILNRVGDDAIAGTVTTYATSFLNELRASQVACACWYAWADGMDNGYGLVRSDGSPRQPLYNTFLA